MSEFSVAKPKIARRRRLGSVWVAPVLAILALAAWAFASPVGSSPDDDYHLASIWCAAGDRTSLCEPGTHEATRFVSEALLDAACYSRDSTSSGECQEGTFDGRSLVESSRGNFAGEYPPVYYATMSLFATDDVQSSVVTMRLVNAALLVGMLTVLSALLPGPLRQTLLWSWLITVIPLGLFLIASINPSAWAVVGVGTGWMALLGYLDSAGRRRLAFGAVFAAAAIMAIGSRADSAIYLGLAILALLFLRFRAEGTFVLAATFPLAVMVVAFFVGLSTGQVGAAINGFGGVASPLPGPLLTTGVATPVISGPLPLEDSANVAAGGSTIGLLVSNLVNAPSIWAGVFGSWSLGWFDTAMPYVVALGGAGVFAAVTFAGLTVITWRKAAIMAGLVVALWAIPVFTLTRGGDMVGVEVQPRYLLPLIILLAGFSLLPVGVRSIRLSLLQRVIIIGTSIGTQSLALFYNIRRYVTGDDVGGVNLDENLEWWWVGVPAPMFVWFGATVLWAVMVILVVRHLSSVNKTESGLQ